jgi:membrane protein
LGAFYYSILDYFFEGFGYHAAAVSFYTLMSIVPLFIVLTVIISFFATDYKIIVDLISEFFPDITNQFLKLVDYLSEKRAIFGIAGFFIAFYFANSIFTSLHNAVVYVFENPKVSIKKAALIHLF